MQNTTVSQMVFPTCSPVFLLHFLFITLRAKSSPVFTIAFPPILDTCQTLYLLSHPVIFCNYWPPVLFNLTHSTILFPAIKVHPAVALVALTLAVQTLSQQIWSGSAAASFFALYHCQPPLHTVFFFLSIKDVSVCDIVAGGGGGVEAKLFHLKQLKPGSIPV